MATLQSKNSMKGITIPHGWYFDRSDNLFHAIHDETKTMTVEQRRSQMEREARASSSSAMATSQSKNSMKGTTIPHGWYFDRSDNLFHARHDETKTMTVEQRRSQMEREGHKNSKRLMFNENVTVNPFYKMACTKDASKNPRVRNNTPHPAPEIYLDTIEKMRSEQVARGTNRF